VEAASGFEPESRGFADVPALVAIPLHSPDHPDEPSTYERPVAGVKPGFVGSPQTVRVKHEVSRADQADRPLRPQVESRGRLYLQLGLPAAVDLVSTEIKLATDPTARERNKLLFGGGRIGRIGYNVGATVVGAELARLLQKAGIGWGAKVVKATSIGVHGAAVVITWR
jgi:hypothetical protein